MSCSLKLSGISFEAFPLVWDTDYFGVQSARVILKDAVSKSEQEKIIDYCSNFEFVTFSNLRNKQENNTWIGSDTTAFLTDLNMQFTKHIDEQSRVHDNFINIYNAFPRNEEVLKIAQHAYLYSRFFNDPWLPREKAQNVYVHWTSCAFNKPEKYFVIAEKNHKIIGYLLFFINEEHANAVIELIATSNLHRGQNIGGSLMANLESFAFEKGLKTIKVGTQADNILGVRFYNKCGFQYILCNSIYHYWPNRRA